MKQTKTAPEAKPKHIKSFWGLVIILVIALVLGGIILIFAQNNVLQDDINSSSFAPLGFLKKLPAKKTTPKGNALLKKAPEVAE